jgi:hypothetical protein
MKVVSRHWKGALGAAIVLAIFGGGLAYSVQKSREEAGYRSSVVRHINDMNLRHGGEPPKLVPTLRIAPDGTVKR